jgi:Zinc finger, C3HC4 type (RING finger)
LTNTYFKKSQLRDLKDLQKKIASVKRRYRSKQSNLSFNLEDYLHTKEKLRNNYKTNGKDFTPGGKMQVTTKDDPEIEKATHMSMASARHLRRLGEQFMRDYLPPVMRHRRSVSGQQSSHCSTVKLKECVVCMSGTADGVIMPCGHGGICYQYAVHPVSRGG